MSDKLNRKNAIELLENENYVVLSKAEFERFNKSFGTVQNQVNEIQSTLRSNVTNFTPKDARRLDSLFSKVADFFSRWEGWFEDNNGESFDSFQTNRTSASSARTGQRSGAFA